MRKKVLVLFAALLVPLSGAAGCQQILNHEVRNGKQQVKQKALQQKRKIERQTRQEHGNVKRDLRKAQKSIDRVNKKLNRNR